MQLWLHGWLSDDHQQSARLSVELGVRNLVLGPSQEDVALARDSGLTPWVSIGAFSVGADEEHLLCRSLQGHPRLWFGSGCPSNPAVVERLLDNVRSLARWDIAGIFLDGIRFASPFEGSDTFFTCSCRWCRSLASDYGLSFVSMESALASLVEELASIPASHLGSARNGLIAPADLLPLLLANSEIANWLRLRSAIINDVVAQVRAVLKATKPDAMLAAYVFTPSLAPLVGQDYRSLAQHLAVIAPMIYRFGDGPACLPAEITALSNFTREDVRAVFLDAILSALGFPGETRVASGEMGTAAIEIECERARARIGTAASLVPILWLDDSEMADAVKAALVGQPAGLSFFRTGEHKMERLAAAARALKEQGIEIETRPNL